MGWREDQEKEQKLLREKFDRLIHDCLIKDLKVRFFKNFGCINFQSDDYMHEVKLARMFHAWHAKIWPNQHDLHEEEPMRCYHVTKCKCGFEEACDSSD